MEEEDDDFYDPADAVPTTQSHNDPQQPSSNGKSQEPYDEEEVEEEEEDEDDFNIITEAPPDAPPPEIQHPRHANLRNEFQRPSSADSSNVSKSITPSVTPRVEPQTPVTSTVKPTGPQKPGSAYPAIHSSTIDVNANPIHPATGKPITSTDLDNDFSGEDAKPWRRPGSDISDYFNYGFDEFTWASYCLKQQELRREVGDQKKQVDEMQTFLTMGMPPMPGGPQPAPGGPPGSGAPGMPAMPTMPGMPDMSPEIMQGMLGNMMAQGLDPSSMDPMSFMQHAQAMMGGQSGGGAGPSGQPQMGYGGYDQRGGYSGRGRGGRRW
ncbi:Pre-mRNA polyadenylation factor fip-1 [Aspergillus sclerotialis]|uniref:Pre-mRNA polyadenylation factor fip-1 n=1 Tax=Aspergillus sclerotialis TaxID=2070753 RepID=A0A3A3AA47_9EURO|nr:Pre-mRNA polyadenylation factor fip-1 [Aspergillus sclerotialis]